MKIQAVPGVDTASQSLHNPNSSNVARTGSDDLETLLSETLSTSSRSTNEDGKIYSTFLPSSKVTSYQRKFPRSQTGISAVANSIRI